MTSSSGSWSSGGPGLEAINRAGVSYFLHRPYDSTGIRALIETTVPVGGARPVAEAAPRSQPPRAELRRFPGIVGRSAPMLELLDMVWRVGQSDCAVLVTGETGTGKELVGRAIHRASTRNERTFAAVNSAAFPEGLLESELFGHRRGSFTGAHEHGRTGGSALHRERRAPTLAKSASAFRPRSRRRWPPPT